MARKQSLPKHITLAEMRTKLQQTQLRLDKCLAYNKQWQEVATGLERQRGELLEVVERQRAEIEYFKRLALGKQVVQ